MTGSGGELLGNEEVKRSYLEGGGVGSTEGAAG